MEIRLLNLIEGARAATGLTVIIDVFRAFSVECYAFANGAEQILPVADINLAYKLKEENPDYILIGERYEQMPKGFDFGNSPSQILNEDLSGKTIVHTTSAGTQGLVNAIHAEEILTGSFVNAGAIVKYIQKKNPTTVSLVGMGYSTTYPVEEDVACAEYIANELKGTANDFDAMVEHIRLTSGARFFLEDKQHFAPKEDFDLCLNINRFDFVLKGYTINDQLVIKKISN
jgi:2-phosphosulfolactate phosphatase